MPRQARLDAPGALHHVIGRGIEKSSIFGRSEDCVDFLSRLEMLARKKAVIVYAWSLMGNHFHLLVRTGIQPLSASMRVLMTGYAVNYNIRHKRCGHVFQNRFKSILCEDEPYFLELVRYIHLNPLRAGVVSTLDALRRSQLTGHAVLLGEADRPWQDSGYVLEQFSKDRAEARKAYEQFIEEGLREVKPRNLEGGGLVRSAGGWQFVRELRNAREGYRSDERVLGSSIFVDQLLEEVEDYPQENDELVKHWTVERLTERICKVKGVPVIALGGGGKEPSVSKAREGISYLWVKRLGRNGVDLARFTGMKPSTIYQAARRGERESNYWEQFVENAKS